MWLPAGGHVDENETPEDALKREFLEEVNLEIEMLNLSSIENAGRVKKRLALPIDIHIHEGEPNNTVGNHDHCCFFYACEAKDVSNIKIEEDEINDARWFSKEDLSSDEIDGDVRNIALRAFDFYK